MWEEETKCTVAKIITGYFNRDQSIDEGAPTTDETQRYSRVIFCAGEFIKINRFLIDGWRGDLRTCLNTRPTVKSWIDSRIKLLIKC